MSSVQPPAFEAPRLVPIVHADDCGLSEGITDAIMACHDRGWLRRTSVVANGAAWEHAVERAQRRESLAVVLHLNLFEGLRCRPQPMWIGSWTTGALLPRLRGALGARARGC